MADEVIGSEQSLDQQLEELLGTGAPASASTEGTPPNVDPKAGVVASPPPSETPKEGEAPVVDELEKALEGIQEETVEPKKETPALSDEQQQILNIVPDRKTAESLYGVVQNYNNFAGAFESGKFDEVQQMFEQWNPAAYEAFLDHIYTTKVFNTDEWVNRYIADKEGRGKTHDDVKALQNELKQLKNQINQGAQQQTQQVQQTQEQRSFAEHTKHVNSLFELIKFPEADRRYVVADLNQRIVSDPKLLAAVRTGNVNAVNAVFKATVREYVNRDKQIKLTEEQKIAQQAQKKMPLGGGSATPETNQLPDDVRQVPKGQEDNWLDQKLGQLFSKKK